MSAGRNNVLGPVYKYVFLGLLVVAVSVLAEPVTSVKQASEIAQQAYGGQVVKAEETDVEDKKVYLIRVVNEGRVRDVMIDPEDGNILNP
jgi:uncharacterized membrane protein YkoI